jgi:hypothetical protein
MIDVFSPEGKKGKLPQSQAMDAIRNGGFEHAVRVTSPEGKGGWMPRSKVAAAMVNGFKVGQPAVQNMGEPSTVGTLAREGTLGAAGTVLPESEHPFLDALKHISGYDELQKAIEEGKKGNVGASIWHSVKSAPTGISTLETVGHQFIDQEKQALEEQQKHPNIPAIANPRVMLHAAGGVVPIIGPAIAEGVEETQHGIDQRDPAAIGHGAGKTIGTVAQVLLPEALETKAADTAIQTTAKPIIATTKAVTGAPRAIRASVSPKFAAEQLPAESLAMKATKPRNSINNVTEKMQTALPDARRAADSLGINVTSLDEARTATMQAKKDVWGEYQQNHLEPGKQSGLAIDGNKIADAMESKITRKMEIENPEKAQAIRDKAKLYRRDIPVSEAEELMENANNGLNAHYAKTKVSQRVAANDPEIGPDVAFADTLRGELNKTLEKVSGPGGEELRKRYGALTTLEDVLNRRINVAERQAPESLIEQMGKKDAAIATGKAAVKFITGRPFAAVADVVGAMRGLRAAKNLRTANDADFLIGKSFEKTAPRPAPVLIARPSPASSSGGIFSPATRRFLNESAANVKLPGEIEPEYVGEPDAKVLANRTGVVSRPRILSGSIIGQKALPPAGLPEVSDTEVLSSGKAEAPRAASESAAAQQIRSRVASPRVTVLPERPSQATVARSAEPSIPPAERRGDVYLRSRAEISRVPEYRQALRETTDPAEKVRLAEAIEREIQFLKKQPAQAIEHEGLPAPGEAEKHAAEAPPIKPYRRTSEIEEDVRKSGMVYKGQTAKNSGVFQIEHPDFPGKPVTMKASEITSPEVVRERVEAQVGKTKNGSPVKSSVANLSKEK